MVYPTNIAKKIAVCAVTGAVAIAALAGCASQPAQSSSSQDAASSFAAEASDTSASESTESAASAAGASASAAAVEETLVIGEESDETLTMTVVNKLGSKITDIAFSAAGSEDEPAYLMESGQKWKSGKEAIVHFPSAGEGTNYDVHVKSGDTAYTLHNMLLDGVDELTICIEGDIAYATFERDGNAISTLREESDLAEQATADEAVEEAPAEEEYYEEEYYEEEYYEEPAQEEDSCVEGGVQLR